jgi:hypothetical protein
MRELAAILDAAAAGSFPPADGRVTILPQPSERDAGVISFTGHAVIFSSADPDWVAAQLSPGDFAGPLSIRFLQALSEQTGRIPHGIDMLTCATALPGPPPVGLQPDADRQHPRLQRALGYRDDIRAWRTAGGILLLGRGVAGRWEAGVEVDPGSRDQGLGTRLAMAARHLVPDGAPVWAQIAPANAASVRAFLAAGFRPVAAEALLTSGPQV